MAFAIKYNGKYLHVTRNPSGYSSRKRRWTDTLEQATLWEKPAHAKNALLVAYDAKVLPKRAIARIVEVSLVEFNDPELSESADYRLTHVGPYKQSRIAPVES